MAPRIGLRARERGVPLSLVERGLLDRTVPLRLGHLRRPHLHGELGPDQLLRHHGADDPVLRLVAPELHRTRRRRAPHRRPVGLSHRDPRRVEAERRLRRRGPEPGHRRPPRSRLLSDLLPLDLELDPLPSLLRGYPVRHPPRIVLVRRAGSAQLDRHRGTTSPTGFPILDALLHGDLPFAANVLTRTLLQGGIIAIAYLAIFFRYARNAIGEAMREPYIR